MKQTLKDVIGLMGKLRNCLPLFISATLTTCLAQLTLVGVSVVSVWISSSFFTDINTGLVIPFTILFSLVAGYACANLLEVWWSHEVAYKILHTFRLHIYAAIKRIAPLGLQGKRTGDVASAAMNDAETLEWFYAHTASTAICAILSPAIFIATLCWLVGPIGLIMAAPVILMIAFPLVLMPIQQRQGVNLRQKLAELRIAALDSIQGQRELRSLGMVARQNQTVLEITSQVQRLKNAQAMRKAWESAFAALVTAAASTVLLINLTGRVLSGGLPGNILPIAIVLAGMSTIPAITQVGMEGKIGEIGACARRINQILEAKDPIPADLDPSFTQLQDEQHTLVAQDVSFSYGDQQVLNKIDITASPTRSIAIVGSSGAGKTTFANLAMRFLDPDTGSLRFDGLNLRGYRPDEYRQRLAMVPQDCHIFAGTVRKNLELAKPDATDPEIWDALRAADVNELVESLGGLDAPVGDRGTTLSGGERQRIGIARAFLRNPDLLILDEPLANIDPFLEATISANVKNLRAKRSTIVIAHRLTSIRIADEIVVLDQGEIVARGTHKELLANPFYCQLLGDQIRDLGLNESYQNQGGRM